MASFIYFYSKFTEEFLLLTAAAAFGVLAVYCYHWVLQRRRLGAARNGVPTEVVKAYLNQLINEAQFVRTQLFGLVGSKGAGNMAALRFNTAPAAESHGGSPAMEHPPGSESSGEIPSDLLERLQALESQLEEKESMVVNINVEKTKLLEELENLKQNQNAMAGSDSSDNSGLLEKIKLLESRLEEYALFEDDLSSLKRLQQENNALKEQLEGGPTTQAAPIADAEPTVEAEPVLEAAPVAEAVAEESIDAMETSPDPSLDQSAIDKLLDGVPAIPPEENSETVNAEAQPAVEAASSDDTTPADDFEKLVDSVEVSLEASPSDSPPPEGEEKTGSDEGQSKSDEELLKEFESLLNS